MNRGNSIKIAALLGALAVLIGAFGAHGLHDVLVENNRLETFETGVRYHFYHVFALFITALLYDSHSKEWLRRASLLFFLGVFIFSGSLYLLAISNITVLGAITPVGGLCFVFGWLSLFKAVK